MMPRRPIAVLALVVALICGAATCVAAPAPLTPESARAREAHFYRVAQRTMLADPTPRAVQDVALTLSRRLQNLSRRTAAGQALTAHDIVVRDLVATYLGRSSTRWAEVGLGSRDAGEATALQTEADAALARDMEPAPPASADARSALMRQCVIGLLACGAGVAVLMAVRRADGHRRAKAAAYRPLHAATSRQRAVPRRRPRR